MKIKNVKKSSLIIGSSAAVIIFIIFGAISSIIPNPFFVRMEPVYFYDYIFLFLTPALAGAYIGLRFYTRRTKKKCSYAATGGALGGFFSFGCAICNKLAVLLLGLSGVAAYFSPLQPILGLLSILLLGYAVYAQARFLRNV